MKRTKSIPGFDAIACKRKAALQIYLKIKGMIPDQEIAFFSKTAQEGPLAGYWNRLVKEGRQCQPAVLARTRKGST